MAEFVESNKNIKRVVVFSKTHCPYCTNAKKALEQVGLFTFRDRRA